MSGRMSDDKQGMRSRLLPILRAIPADRARQAGIAIADHLERWSAWSRFREVVLFANVAGEVDSAPLFEAARRARMQILLPRMLPDSQLEFAPVDPLGSLTIGRFGVREPDQASAGQVLDPRALVLVPGVAFDRRGGRLGRGAGYYDRALTRLRENGMHPFLLGVAFELQQVARVPMGGHDVFVDAVVTEEGLRIAPERGGHDGGPAGSGGRAPARGVS